MDRASRIAKYKALLGDGGVQLEIARTFSGASEVVLAADGEGLRDFAALNDSKLLLTPGGLKISALGTDAQVMLPKFALPAGRSAILRIDLEAPAETGLQLFHSPDPSGYGEHIIDRYLTQGSNTIYFELTSAEVAAGRLRLDPGMVAGDYVITHFEVRSIPTTP
jgi:hypothetical protein